MDNYGSIPNGPQGPTLTGLKMQYRDLLLPLQERFWSHELTCAPAIAGTCYEDSPFRLMYVGRAVNGWEAKWLEGPINDLVEQVFAYDFKMASIFENPNQNGYNFNISGFWQLCKEIMKLAGEEENWSDKVLWSNLYKVAPYNGGNPGNKLIEKTIERCIQILTYEIRLYRPTHVVFITGDWWFDPSNTFKASFAKKLGISVEHNTDKSTVIIGKGNYEKSLGNVKMVVSKRPEGLKGVTREKHAELIIDALGSLD